MSALDTIKAARIAGVRLALDGEDLVLEAQSQLSPALLDALSHHKAEIVALLLPGRDGWSAEDWRVFFDERAGIAEFDGGLPGPEAEAYAFECCVVEWLNRHPCLSTPTRCAQCNGLGSISAVVLPFGTEPGPHVWVHAECYAAWQAARRAQAVKALALMGINPPVPWTQGRGHKNPRTTP